MDNPRENAKSCMLRPYGNATRNFEGFAATRSATDNATGSLKALAGAVLERNTQCNGNATTPEKQCNFYSKKNAEKLRCFNSFSSSTLTQKPER